MLQFRISLLSPLALSLLALSLLALSFALPAAGLDVVYVARHAQKSADAAWEAHGRLRPLSEKGAHCATALGRKVADAGVAAAYASETARTLGTALVISGAGEAKAIGDDRSAFDTASFVEDVRRAHADDQAVVVIGHSNTVGRVVAAFAPGAEACFAALGLRGDGTVDETRYGDVWRIAIGAAPCDGGVERSRLDGSAGKPADGGPDCSTP